MWLTTSVPTVLNTWVSTKSTNRRIHGCHLNSPVAYNIVGTNNTVTNNDSLPLICASELRRTDSSTRRGSIKLFTGPRSCDRCH